MNKEFVPYEEALELKALGFDSLKKEPCLAYYNESNSNHDLETTDWWCLPQNDFQYALSAPTFSQAFRWFREKHKLHYPIAVSDGIWFYAKWSLGGYKTYEEAELECLKKLIEIVKDKK